MYALEEWPTSSGHLSWLTVPKRENLRLVMGLHPSVSAHSTRGMGRDLQALNIFRETTLIGLSWGIVIRRCHWTNEEKGIAPHYTVKLITIFPSLHFVPFETGYIPANNAIPGVLPTDSNFGLSHHS